MLHTLLAVLADALAFCLGNWVRQASVLVGLYEIFFHLVSIAGDWAPKSVAAGDEGVF